MLALETSLNNYYNRLESIKAQGFSNEKNTQSAFKSLLIEQAEARDLVFVGEADVAKGKFIDGVIRTKERFPFGYWEAKDEKDKLDVEIGKKIAIGYPTSNTIFEDTRTAVLFQNGRPAARFDMKKRDELGALLERFFGYTREDFEGFEQAMAGFTLEIPAVARALDELIALEALESPRFQKAFDKFFRLCQSSLNPHIKVETTREMLIQHLLTERLFRGVFGNSDWASRNAVAGEIEKVIAALTARKFSRDKFLAPLDSYYSEIEKTGQTIELWSDKQAFLNTVYEKFFQNYSAESADTMGIVYTPQEIVNWMVKSVETTLQNEWGKSLADTGVHVLDPCTGTGNFLVRVMDFIATDLGQSAALFDKYNSELWANEIMLLPYYIASGNIEHKYFDTLGEYRAFEGLCFADTLDLFKGSQLSIKEFDEANAERVEHEMAAPIRVIIGNPPYNVGQKNENDNNKNRPYPDLDKTISQTWAKASNASNKNGYRNPYVRFWKWAAERLNGEDGLICFVTDNSFVDAHMFDGIRKGLASEFNHIWHLDLHGNVRQNPKLSGTTHNVFGIQVGVGITICVRNSQSAERFIKYHRVPEFARRLEKLDLLRNAGDVSGIEWQTLAPNAKNAWLTEGLEGDFETFLPMGTKDAKRSFSPDIQTVFRSYGRGVATCRDDTVYDFNRDKLTDDVKQFIEIYNSEVERWKASDQKTIIDDFVDYSEIKWSRDLKLDLQRGRKATFKEENIRLSHYRPFCKKWLYLDRILNEEVYAQPSYFPLSDSENRVIWVKVGREIPFFALMTDCIPDLLPQGGSQCFPFYTYSPDGETRTENITSHALKLFQEKYGDAVSKWDVFHYVYALLHLPTYRARYAENLRRDLPHLPLLDADFAAFSRIGRELGELHVGFESAPTLLDLRLIETRGANEPLSFRVEAMKWNKDKSVLVLNKTLSLGGFSPALFDYKLGNRSALDWLVESFRVKTDARSGLSSDPNHPDEPRYILDLVRRVAFVAQKTRELVAELEASCVV